MNEQRESKAIAQIHFKILNNGKEFMADSNGQP